MNKHTLAAALAVLSLAGAASAQFTSGVVLPGQNLLSGWDFNAGNTNATFVNREIEPRYSDLRKDSNLFGNVVDLGSGIFFRSDRSFTLATPWSISATNGAAIATVNPASQSPDTAIGTPARTDSSAITNPTGLFGVDLGEISGLVEGALQLQTRTAGGPTGINRFAIQFDTRNASGISMLLSHRLQGSGTGTGSIAWSYIIDSVGTEVPTGITTNIATGTSAYTQDAVDFSSITALNNAGLVYLVGTVSQSALGRPILLDNIGIIAANAIPEPSTYAILAGVTALGLVVLRRRRS